MPSTNEKYSAIDNERDFNDQDFLARLGYKEEFKRDFSRFELFGLSFSIMGVVQSIVAVLLYSIPYGGPVGMVWGWFTCCIFISIVSLAMAELGSAAPTAGGLYYWTFKFSSPRYRKLFSWLVGYMSTSGTTASIASVDWGCATQLLAAVNIRSGGKFVATNAQTYGVYCALLFLNALSASLATKVIARLQHFYIFLNLALFLTVIIALPITTPRQFVNKASFAFGDFVNGTGWPNGFAFILSFLAPSWTVAGFDVSVLISEEARNAPRAVPFAIVCSTILGSVLGWIVNIVLAIHIGNDLETVVTNPIGQPMASVFANSVGPTETVVVWAFIVITLWITGMDVLIVGSRQIFALFRDQGLPFSKYLYRMIPHTQTPVNAVCVILSLLLGLLCFAGPLAITAVFTMPIVCLYIGSVTSIIARFVGGSQFVPGPFNLARMSGPVAFVVSIYLLLMTVVFLFPPLPAPTLHSMNNTLVVVAGIIFLSLAYDFFPKYGGRYWFTGPVHTITV